MSLIRGVLLAGQFRNQHQINTMTHDDQRNTLLVELSGRTNQPVPHFQAMNDDTLAGAGAVLVFLRKRGIRTDAQLKTISDDDQRNILIVELGAQTHLPGPVLQGMSNIDLVLLGLGKGQSFIRGVLLAGQFRTQRQINTMTHDDQRNTLIVELSQRINQPVAHFQSLTDDALAGAGAILLFLSQGGIRTDAQLKTISDDDQRNIAIVEIGAQTNLGSKLQGLSNLTLVLTALGVDPVFTPPPPPPLPDQLHFDSGQVNSNLALNGNAQLLLKRDGAFTLTGHVHGSGADPIDYGMVITLATAPGDAFQVHHEGNVPGNVIPNPIDPDPNDNFFGTGNLVGVTERWNDIVASGRILGTLTGVDKLESAVADLLAEAAKEAAAAGVKAIISAIAA